MFPLVKICFLGVGLSAFTCGFLTDCWKPLPAMSALNMTEEKSAKTPQKKPEICLDEGCVHAASMVLGNMDMSVEPCDDFYQFVCGQFRKRFIPDHKSALNYFSLISDKLEGQLRDILTEPSLPGEIQPIYDAKSLYQLCMNETKIEMYGTEPVLKLFEQLGGWPVLDENWDRDGSWNWRDTIYKFRAHGFSVDYFFDFSIGSDLKNTSYRIITFDQPPLGLSREYLVQGMNHTKVKAYYDYMVDIAVLFSADEAQARKQLMESLELEMQLAKLSLPREERRNANKLYNKMTLGSMMLKFPTIPWREYVTRLLPPMYDIKEEEPVIVAVPEYITGVEKILEQTPKKVLANYLLWRAASSTIFYLPTRFRDRQQKYARATSGSKMRQPRWMECSGLAAGSVSLAVSSLYVERYFNDEAKQMALDLVDRVKKEFFHTLETLDWMDEETRKAALEKAGSMVAHIAYPEELRNKKKIVDFYKEVFLPARPVQSSVLPTAERDLMSELCLFKLTIDRDGDYLQAILNLTTFGTNYTLSQLREKINKTDWISHSKAAVVNAYYSPLENSIQFPAGILQEIFFSDKRPSYMNFGTIGFVIGHEITHGFDDQGKQFDKNGDLMEWWADETKTKYSEMAQCIINQYGNYTSKQVNMKLNGINTQGENIADNGGLKHAYRAYLSWVADNGEEPRLPGLHQFTPLQMFWVSTASSWCSAFRPESLSNLITTGYHSPPEFRILGPMSNLPEFAKDFNCPLGSRMNPVKKCVVW
ncbi:neprilysin-2 isoform X2 [Cimex lectularius]|uniref:Uncharacterized protein n=1 Tax=Cimex lectularius TaxID=79782 RepID=A0A8I6TEW7_CIMLE|nr:neprilysin-2 isoform X2 [Cimex lectularius]